MREEGAKNEEDLRGKGQQQHMVTNTVTGRLEKSCERERERERDTHHGEP